MMELRQRDSKCKFIDLCESLMKDILIVGLKDLHMYHSQISGYVKRTWNVHNIYNIEQRNPETRNTRNDFLVQVRNFLLPLSLKVLRHKERDTHSFYSGFPICPPPPSRAAPVARKFVWPLRVPKVHPSRSVSSSQLTDFFKIPKILRARFRCMTSLTSTGQPLYLGFLF